MPISQCPRCVLKFSTRSEMQWHLREDHPREKAAKPAPDDRRTAPTRPAAATGATRAAPVVAVAPITTAEMMPVVVVRIVASWASGGTRSVPQLLAPVERTVSE